MKLVYISILLLVSSIIYSCVDKANATDTNSYDYSQLLMQLEQLEQRVEEVEKLELRVEALELKINNLEIGDSDSNIYCEIVTRIEILEQFVENSGSVDNEEDKPYGYREPYDRIIDQIYYDDSGNITTKYIYSYDDLGRIKDYTYEYSTSTSKREYEYYENEILIYLTTGESSRKLDIKYVYQPYEE